MHTSHRLTFRHFGKPSDVLEIEPFTPTPAEGEILVRILSAPINPADLNFIEGTYGVKPALPTTPGIEGCGIVESHDHPDFPNGSIVAFLGRSATWATHTCVPPDSLILLPQTIDPLQAAMLKVNPATAWLLIHHFATLNPGDWIVQNAATSSVGQCVIQIARQLGLRTINFIRRPETATNLPSLGADHILPDTEEGQQSALEILHGKNASIAFNAVGGESALRLMNLLRDGSHHITYGAMARRPLTVPNGILIFRDIRISGFWLSRWVENTSPTEVRSIYQKLATQIDSGSLTQRIDSTPPRPNFQTALTRLTHPHRLGKILLTP
jgi:NADPH:quinone reductase-like Zn-dependent oxidoreductase